MPLFGSGDVLSEKIKGELESSLPSSFINPVTGVPSATWQDAIKQDILIELRKVINAAYPDEIPARYHSTLMVPVLDSEGEETGELTDGMENLATAMSVVMHRHLNSVIEKMAPIVVDWITANAEVLSYLTPSDAATFAWVPAGPAGGAGPVAAVIPFSKTGEIK